MVPPQEGLGADQLARAKIEQRMVDEKHLLAFEGVSQTELDVRTLHRMLVYLRRKETEGVSTRRFRLVHRRIGIAQERMRAVAIGRKHRNANADRGRNLPPLQRKRPAKRGEDLVGNHLRLRSLAQIGQHDDKLVAAETTHRVAGANARGEAVGRFDQKRVAGRMTEGIVDRLEIVEIDERQGHALFIPLGPGDRLVDAVQRQQSVGEARQVVETGLMEQAFLVFLANRDVFLDGDIVGDLAVGGLDRRDRGEFPEHLAVLLPVEQFAAPFAPRRDRLPQITVAFLGHEPGLEKARVLADDLVRRVTRQLDELGVDVLDFALGIGDQDRGGALLDRLRQLSQAFLRLFSLGDVVYQTVEALNLAVLGEIGDVTNLGVTLAVGIAPDVFETNLLSVQGSLDMGLGPVVVFTQDFLDVFAVTVLGRNPVPVLVGLVVEAVDLVAVHVRDL